MNFCPNCGHGPNGVDLGSAPAQIVVNHDPVKCHQEAILHLEEEIDELRGNVEELRHALEHVVECDTCASCVRMSSYALIYGNHDDFVEVARDRHYKE